MATMLPATAREPSVTFWGAAQSVTGSMHILRSAGRRILLDCGLSRSRHHHAPTGHEPFPLPPSQIDAVVLSHAHSDHCGHLPQLVRQGFTGPIYCTPATRDLTALMLAHSFRFQRAEALATHVLEDPGNVRDMGSPSRSDVDRTICQCVTVPYGQDTPLGDGLQLCLLDAGHILGSAVVVLTVPYPHRPLTLVFTGDLGRREPFLLSGVDTLPPADLLICESTYGGRALESVASAVTALETVVRRTVERGGKVLIPTFSLGRMQVVAYALSQAIRNGRLPPVPVFVDSPLAAEIADVYRRHSDRLAAGVRRRLEEGQDLLGGPEVGYVRDGEDSQELSTRSGPAVWIAPGGMCEGGRIVEHIKRHIDDPRCSVVLVNYQAPHTLGRRLMERGPTVRFHGRSWNKWAEVAYLPGFSGHADQNDLLAYLGPLAGRVGRVRLVHGEVEEAETLAAVLRGLGFADVSVPCRGSTIDWSDV